MSKLKPSHREVLNVKPLLVQLRAVPGQRGQADLGMGQQGGAAPLRLGSRSCCRTQRSVTPCWGPSFQGLSVLVLVGMLLPTLQAPAPRSWTGHWHCQTKQCGLPPSTQVAPITEFFSASPR